jgi:hypothetical protein
MHLADAPRAQYPEPHHRISSKNRQNAVRWTGYERLENPHPKTEQTF